MRYKINPKIVFVIASILTIFIAGFTSTAALSSESLVQKNAQVQEILKLYPDAEISFLYYNNSQSLDLKEEYESICNEQFSSNILFRFSIQDEEEDLNIVGYYNINNDTVDCFSQVFESTSNKGGVKSLPQTNVFGNNSALNPVSSTYSTPKFYRKLDFKVFVDFETDTSLAQININAEEYFIEFKTTNEQKIVDMISQEFDIDSSSVETFLTIEDETGFSRVEEISVAHNLENENSLVQILINNEEYYLEFKTTNTERIAKMIGEEFEISTFLVESVLEEKSEF